MKAAKIPILSAEESRLLTQLEGVIERGMPDFLNVAEALLTISEQRLYRVSHSSFELYCQERWQMTGRRAYQLCQAAEIVKRIASKSKTVNNCSVSEGQSVNNCSVLPKTESQVRPLAKLPPEEQKPAWEQAVVTAPNGKVTARHVAEVVESRMPEKPESEPDFAAAINTLGKMEEHLRQLYPEPDFVEETELETIYASLARLRDYYAQRSKAAA
jgi:hypothetical protein